MVALAYVAQAITNLAPQLAQPAMSDARHVQHTALALNVCPHNTDILVVAHVLV